MGTPRILVLLLSICLGKIVVADAPSDGKEIANKLGDDLSFASKQLIRGFTSIFGPLIDTFEKQPSALSKIIPGGGGAGMNEATQNFRKVIVRDGVNMIGKGVKAGATIISTPARVAGTGIEEVQKVREAAGISSRMGESHTLHSKNSHAPVGNVQSGIEGGTKIVSNLFNTTASEFSQANLGAVLVELALKNRIRDIGNKTADAVQSRLGPRIETKEINKREDPDSSSNKEDPTPAPSRVDALIARFNEAVKQNDERVMNALQSILSRINPPKQ